MRWGDFQSVFQLATALNFAFYTFKEIRSPVARELEQYLRTASREVFAVHDLMLDQDHRWNEMWDDIHEPVDKGVLRHENLIEYLAFCSSIICAALLIYSSYNYEQDIVFPITIIAIFVGYGPALLLLVSNLLASHGHRVRIDRTRRYLDEMTAIVKKAGPTERIGPVIVKRKPKN
jgi:hypothetical protein